MIFIANWQFVLQLLAETREDTRSACRRHAHARRGKTSSSRRCCLDAFQHWRDGAGNSADDAFEQALVYPV